MKTNCLKRIAIVCLVLSCLAGVVSAYAGGCAHKNIKWNGQGWTSWKVTSDALKLKHYRDHGTLGVCNDCGVGGFIKDIDNHQEAYHNYSYTYFKGQNLDMGKCKQCNNEYACGHVHNNYQHKWTYLSLLQKDRAVCVCGEALYRNHVHVFVQQYTVVNGKKRPTFKKCACGMRK